MARSGELLPPQPNKKIILKKIIKKQKNQYSTSLTGSLFSKCRVQSLFGGNFAGNQYLKINFA